jgi:hypothetical protein
VKIASAEDEAGGADNSPAGREPGGAESLRKVTVVGTPESQWKAQYLIFEKLREEGFNQGMEDVKLTVEILVPSSQVQLLETLMFQIQDDIIQDPADSFWIYRYLISSIFFNLY